MSLHRMTPRRAALPSCAARAIPAFYAWLVGSSVVLRRVELQWSNGAATCGCKPWCSVVASRGGASRGFCTVSTVVIAISGLAVCGAAALARSTASLPCGSGAAARGSCCAARGGRVHRAVPRRGDPGSASRSEGRAVLGATARRALACHWERSRDGVRACNGSLGSEWLAYYGGIVGRIQNFVAVGSSTRLVMDSRAPHSL